jgi:iron complex outermembrane receptor protein
MRVPLRTRPPLRRAALAAAALLAAGPACAQEPAFEEFAPPAPGAVPIVTPTYLRQSERDIPATITVIDAETIATFGFLTIPNVLRMIEGTPPQRLSWANYDLKVNRRTSFGPSRLTVMVDGIEVDSSHFQQEVDWQAMPVNIDDVERIEVTRGPSTAGFEHALTTVLVNIVTKHPADVERGFVRGTYGSFASTSLFTRAGVSEGPAAIRLTYSHSERDPMDDQGAGVLRSGRVHLDRFNVRTATRVDPQTTLAIDGAWLEDKLSGSPANTASADVVKHSGYASGVWTRSLAPANDVTVRLDHWFELQNSSVPGCGASQVATEADAESAASIFGSPGTAAGRANPLRALAVADPCAISDDDEHRTKLEVQDVQVFSSTLRGVAGIGLRQEEARTSIPQPARWTATFTRLLASMDWQPGPAWTINAGLTADHAGSDEYETTLRAGANWHLTDAQTLRASWALGDWASQAFKILDVSNTVVTQERSDTADIGYLIKVPERNVSLDARAFWMKATGQVWAGNLSRRSGGELPAWGEVWGLETRGTADLTAHISGFLGMAYGEESATSGINNAGTKTFWSGATGFYANLPYQWRVAIAYTTNSGTAPVTGTPGVASATILKDFVWSEARLRASLSYHHTNNVPTQVDGETVLGDQHAFYASVEAAF